VEATGQALVEGARIRFFPLSVLVFRGRTTVTMISALTMTNALSQTITTLPEELRWSLTRDRGKELSAHAQFSIASGVKVYFADPKSPWQRGTNENTNDLLRQYFPKGTDLSRWNAQEIAAIAHTLNTRPRKTLAWKTPAEAFSEHLLRQAGVATTD
jgi:transposase, IS30 family